jgi:acetyl-CoA carboxylase biotin carboxylase subunit
MFETVLVANRGEVAVRVIGTCHRLGMRAVAVYSEADAHALHVRMADDAVLLGPPPPAQSYLDVERVLEAARLSGAQAVHPGYGFLAENAAAARQFAAAGFTWIGPAPEAIATMSDKVTARNVVEAAGVPVSPGSGQAVTDLDTALAEARGLGYPLILKAVGGGGGLGVSVAQDEPALRSVFSAVADRAEQYFGAPGVLLERYLPRARHIEVQVLGLADGRILALGDRDCSVQRRYQKLAEEAPAPGLSDDVRSRLAKAARQTAEAIDYRGLGTVEFLVDPATFEFAFMEMNTRLQVEHPITELVTGIDLVEQQLLVAAGEPPSFDPDELTVHGHAVEARIYAEDPVDFRLGAGKITTWREPTGEGIRVDSGYGRRDRVTAYYDPLLAKVAAWGPDRSTALERLRGALGELKIEGPACNLPFFTDLLADPGYIAGEYDTGLVGKLRPTS